MKYKLERDKVVSLVEENGVMVSRVGVFVIVEGEEYFLGEFSPRKADKIIKLWNGGESGE